MKKYFLPSTLDISIIQDSTSIIIVTAKIKTSSLEYFTSFGIFHEFLRSAVPEELASHVDLNLPPNTKELGY